MSELQEWKLAVVSELVWSVLPDAPEDAKPWEDVAVRAVYEYERDRPKWQDGDPNFDLWRDNFINKNYVLNHRFAIRDTLARKGKCILWHAGAGRGEIYRSETVAGMEKMLAARQRTVEGLADGYNNQREAAGKALAGITSPYLRMTPELPAAAELS